MTCFTSDKEIVLLESASKDKKKTCQWGIRRITDDLLFQYLELTFCTLIHCSANASWILNVGSYITTFSSSSAATSGYALFYLVYSILLDVALKLNFWIFRLEWRRTECVCIGTAALCKCATILLCTVTRSYNPNTQRLQNSCWNADAVGYCV